MNWVSGNPLQFIHDTSGTKVRWGAFPIQPRQELPRAEGEDVERDATSTGFAFSGTATTALRFLRGPPRCASQTKSILFNW